MFHLCANDIRPIFLVMSTLLHPGLSKSVGSSGHLIQLEQHHINIDLERNRHTQFFFERATTEISKEWITLPREDQGLRGECDITVEVELEAFDFPQATLCLYRSTCDTDIFAEDATLNIFGKEYGPKDLFDATNQLTGYVKHDPFSKTNGYLIEGVFYGQIRLFDMLRLHHVTLYVEPRTYQPLYDPDGTGEAEGEGAGGDHAIIFEYVARSGSKFPPAADDYDDSVDGGSSPPDSSSANNSDESKASPPPGDNSASPSADNSPSPLSDESPPPPPPEATPPPAPSSEETKPEEPKNPEDSTEPTETADPGERRRRRRLVGAGTSRRKRQTKDQEAYSHENILNADSDILHSFKFKKGATSHDLFDLRREDAGICRLCVWVQPHFAQLFGFNHSIETGVAEVVDLIKYLNWNFRTLDFDQDFMPENIGFQIGSLMINDEIRVTTTGSKSSFPGRMKAGGQGEDEAKGEASSYSFSSNINSISTKSALALATKHLSKNFPSENCCIMLAFVYHNMIPAVSTTNLRGICTFKNVAVVSGFYGAAKIPKYDVYRGLAHAVGHLFGAHHDDVTNARCLEYKRQRFLNPFLMHPIQQLNVGMRHGSFKMSPCSRDHVTQFLSSNGASCLTSVRQAYCGNGILEDGEECDCGSLWQCHLQEECCGEADTLWGCMIVHPHRSRCLRPRKW